MRRFPLNLLNVSTFNNNTTYRDEYTVSVLVTVDTLTLTAHRLAAARENVTYFRFFNGRLNKVARERGTTRFEKLLLSSALRL